MCCSYGNLLSYVFGAEEYINEVSSANYCTVLDVFLKCAEFLHEYLYLSKIGCGRIDTKNFFFRL